MTVYCIKNMYTTEENTGANKCHCTAPYMTQQAAHPKCIYLMCHVHCYVLCILHVTGTDIVGWSVESCYCEAHSGLSQEATLTKTFTINVQPSIPLTL